MKREWADASHVGKITVSIMDILAKEFHKVSKKADSEKDYDLMIKLSQATGYQAQLYSGLQKSHEFQRRLQSVEKALSTVSAEDIAMSVNPVLQAEEELKTQDEWK